MLYMETSIEKVSLCHSLSLVHFFAPWASACDNLNQVIIDLAKTEKNFKAAVLEAEANPKISLAYNIVSVPVVIFFKNGKEVDRCGSFDPFELGTKVTKHSFYSANAFSSKDVQIVSQAIEALLNKSRLVLVADESPKHSINEMNNKIIQKLNDNKVKFSVCDVSADKEVSHALKCYSSCNTFPQLFLDGKLIGSSDVMEEMMNDPSFIAKLPTTKTIVDRLTGLIKQSRLMLFMKGTPDSPRCGFSRQIVQLLNDVNADFSSFDILSDEEVRQGLKAYSNWPTFPQLYLDGFLIGGLDIIKDEITDPDFLENLPRKV